ncbi:ferredoxin [Lachnospiraceae bacterium 29-84]
MEFFVNDQCIGCGLCAQMCPEVFHLTDEGVSKAAEGAVDGSLEASAQAALDACPANAIEKK